MPGAKPAGQDRTSGAPPVRGMAGCRVGDGPGSLGEGVPLPPVPPYVSVSPSPSSSVSSGPSPIPLCLSLSCPDSDSHNFCLLRPSTSIFLPLTSHLLSSLHFFLRLSLLCLFTFFLPKPFFFVVSLLHFFFLHLSNFSVLFLLCMHVCVCVCVSLSLSPNSFPPFFVPLPPPHLEPRSRAQLNPAFSCSYYPSRDVI